ncbi:MAG: DUF1080 domain-containing protein [Chitinophagaceae bacterium]
MKQTILIYSLLLITTVNAGEWSLKTINESSIEGRWDISIDINGKKYPSWLEVVPSGSKWLVGSYVGIVGSARPISKINFSNGKMSFTIPPQWESETNDVSFEATLQSDSLIGTVTGADGRIHNWVGHRAPYLHRATAPAWGKPIQLFTGTNLKGWHAMGDNQWVAAGGILKNPRSGSNLVTDQKFNDFKLHIEFRCPAGSNSGVYLRGRYEVQIEDNEGKRPQKDLMGAIYGFLTPGEMAAKPAGEWQSYDITLIGRMVTIIVNGKTVICSQEIPGITGGALDSKEEEAGPIYLQGDHGAVEFRNIVLTPTSLSPKGQCHLVKG